MSAKLYEIVRLKDGSFALQRADGEEEPLVKVTFSKEAESYLSGSSMDIAKVMIDAGVEAVEDLSKYSEGSEELSETKSRVIH